MEILAFDGWWSLSQKYSNGEDRVLSAFFRAGSVPDRAGDPKQEANHDDEGLPMPRAVAA